MEKYLKKISLPIGKQGDRDGLRGMKTSRKFNDNFSPRRADTGSVAGDDSDSLPAFSCG